MSSPDIILKLSNIESYYGPIMAIRGISIEVPRGKIVTLLGANGAGKTTVLKTISGILDPQKGSIEFLDLEPYRDKLISGLPYGVRKVIELARALCSEPKLILLDEPSSGLNVEETDDMSFWIRDMKTELGITVLMVEHDMTLVNRVSDRVIALNYGKVLAMGTPAEVQRHPDVVAAYLGA